MSNGAVPAIQKSADAIEQMTKPEYPGSETLDEFRYKITAPKLLTSSATKSQLFDA